ncbi:hypothetical protein NUW58_g1252 [Xylaria curta]|uniref:Uncharacterized protein n=1 Tax=Xylaria curta TaxID=42375 RepID=A0ACC1PMU7_9PEZI|nr:hypothetical protein NUW58_g1252 [Xylaria curta]
MSSIFCCSSIKPYRPARLDHEAKFDHFMRWTESDSVTPANDSSLIGEAPYAVQLVRQVNYGPQESIRYFIPVKNDSAFLEVTEDDLLSVNFQKLNSFKNFKCARHNKFFELNLYQENPSNNHHWRANLERPARDIDLALKNKETVQGLDIEEGIAVPAPVHRRSLGLGQEMASSEPRGSLVPGCETSEGEFQEKASLTQLLISFSAKISTLKPILQFLLPGIGENLGSNSILSLMSLDWVNRELDLGFDYEDLWESELTSQNISLFLNACVELPSGESVSLTDIQDLVDRAVFHVDSWKDEQVLGRARFARIVNRALESSASVGWISQNESKIRGILASGPTEGLLKACGRSDEETLRSRRHGKDAETITAWFTKEPLIDDDDDDDNYRLLLLRMFPECADRPSCPHLRAYLNVDIIKDQQTYRKLCGIEYLFLRANAHYTLSHYCDFHPSTHVLEILPCLPSDGPLPADSPSPAESDLGSGANYDQGSGPDNDDSDDSDYQCSDDGDNDQNHSISIQNTSSDTTRGAIHLGLWSSLVAALRPLLEAVPPLATIGLSDKQFAI